MLDSKQTTVEKAPLMNLSDLSYCPGGSTPLCGLYGDVPLDLRNMDLRFPSGIFPSKKSTNILRGSGKQVLIPRERTQKGGELLLQGVF